MYLNSIMQAIGLLMEDLSRKCDNEWKPSKRFFVFVY